MRPVKPRLIIVAQMLEKVKPRAAAASAARSRPGEHRIGADAASGTRRRLGLDYAATMGGRGLAAVRSTDHSPRGSRRDGGGPQARCQASRSPGAPSGGGGSGEGAGENQGAAKHPRRRGRVPAARQREDRAPGPKAEKGGPKAAYGPGAGSRPPPNERLGDPANRAKNRGTHAGSKGDRSGSPQQPKGGTGGCPGAADHGARQRAHGRQLWSRGLPRGG